MGWQPGECHNHPCGAGNTNHLFICVGCLANGVVNPPARFVETTMSCDTCFVCRREDQFVICIKTCDECASDLFKKGDATRSADKMERAARCKEEWDACCSGYKDYVDEKVEVFVSSDEDR